MLNRTGLCGRVSTLRIYMLRNMGIASPQLARILASLNQACGPVCLAFVPRGKTLTAKVVAFGCTDRKSALLFLLRQTASAPPYSSPLPACGAIEGFDSAPRWAGQPWVERQRNITFSLSWIAEENLQRRAHSGHCARLKDCSLIRFGTAYKRLQFPILR